MPDGASANAASRTAGGQEALMRPRAFSWQQQYQYQGELLCSWAQRQQAGT